MTIATFNVNSVRARLPVLTEWLKSVEPDVVALQETKVEDDKFPREELQACGYQLAVHGQQKYNGVALLSRRPIEDVAMGFGDPEFPEDCRIIRGRIGGVLVINTYVPNGSSVGSEKYAYKLRWFERFGRLVTDLARPDDKVVWLGDMNVAPTDDDVFEPENKERSVCFTAEEKAALEAVKSWGWTDAFRLFTQGSGHYSYWEFVIPNGFKRNLGWRIDHIYASPGLVGSCRACVIDKEPRSWERPSDHTPVLAEFAVS